jgi:hypothetical protein
MKKAILPILIIILGVFVFMGFASADSDAEILQPAEQTTNFESIRVGVAGQGGVTFFNGSVLNEEGPYVIADDLRIEGSVWRGSSKGMADGQALKIADAMFPELTGANDLGSTNLKWRNLYLSNNLHVKNANLSGNLDVAGNANVEGSIRASGNIKQDPGSGGVVKAMAQIDGIDDVSNPRCNVIRQYNSQGKNVTCTRPGAPLGIFYVDFGFDVSDRFIQVTPISEINPASFRLTTSAVHSPSDNKEIIVTTVDANTGNPYVGDFFINIY